MVPYEQEKWGRVLIRYGVERYPKKKYVVYKQHYDKLNDICPAEYELPLALACRRKNQR